MGGSGSSEKPTAAGSGESEQSAPAAPHRISNLTNQAVDEQLLKDERGAIQLNSRYVKGDLVDAYTLEPRIVGSGMSGPVQLAKGRDGRKYAVKTFKKNALSKQRLTEMKNEATIYLALDHPKVARLENVYESEEELHLVMEFLAGGELYDRLSSKRQYTEQLAASTTYQMLLAVNYLHSNSLVHRDLKLENFLYEARDTDVLKLIDFGFAKFWDRSTRMSQACGSVHYVAPEVLAHSYTNKADLWSLGVIVFMLCTGSPPFSGNDKEVLGKIREARVNWGSSRFRKLSDLAQGFLRSLLIKDAKLRPDAADCLEHPWIVQCHSLDAHTEIDPEILRSLQDFSHASAFRRAVLTMVAWSLSSEDTVHLRAEFEKLDQDKSGTISQLELKEVLQCHFHMDNEHAEILFQRVDSRNEERISYSDFLAAAMQHRVLMHQDVLKKAFQKFDTDCSGYITNENLRQVIGPDYEGETVEELIDEVDEDKDGRVSLEEFLSFFQRDEHSAGTGPDGKRRGAPTPKHHEMIHSVLNDNFIEHCESMESPTFHGQKSPTLTSKKERRRIHRMCTPCTPKNFNLKKGDSAPDQASPHPPENLSSI